MSLLKDPKRLAELLCSIKVSHTDRPLTPMETAERIKLLEKEGYDKNTLSKRLSLSTDMIDLFLQLLRLPQKIQDIVNWGASKKDTGEISFTSAAELVKLDNPDDMLKLAGAITGMPRPVNKNEVKGIVSLKKNNPGKPIEECITEVLNVTRPVIINHFLFISGIKPATVQSLRKASEKNNTDLNTFSSEIISKKLPNDSVKDVNMHDDYVRIAFTEEGRNHFHKYADSEGISIKDVVNHIFEEVM